MPGMSDGADFEERYAELRADYVRRVRERVSTIERAVGALREGLDVERFEEIRRLVHRLAGSGETMGFSELSARSIELEERLDDVELAAGGTWIEEVEDYCREVRELLPED